jgi:hypothetical protein
MNCRVLHLIIPHEFAPDAVNLRLFKHARHERPRYESSQAANTVGPQFQSKPDCNTLLQPGQTAGASMPGMRIALKYSGAIRMEALTRIKPARQFGCFHDIS